MRFGNILLVAAVAACGHLPGKPGVPNGIPEKPNLPNTGSSEVDPETCHNFVLTDAGMKFKAFLQATKDLRDATIEVTKVIKESCIMMGNELGMNGADLAGDDTNGICAKVFTAYQDGLKVGLKGGAKLKIKYTPAKCTIDASASASAGGGCSGGASAGTGGSGGGGQCKAAGAINASLHAECTPAQLTMDFDAKMALDKTKLEATLKAARDGLPKLLSVSARIKPIQEAVVVWAQALKDLKDMGPKFAQSAKDEAMCVTGQISAAVNAATTINANVSVSVSVSASASGSVGS